MHIVPVPKVAPHPVNAKCIGHLAVYVLCITYVHVCATIARVVRDL